MSAELIRLLENILRVGVVIAVDEESWRVRVQSGELQTDWLRWNTTRAGAFSIWVPPSVGEQVWLGCIGGNPETAVIIGSLYSSDNPAPGSSLKEIVLTAPDGASFRYDAEASALEAQGMKTAHIKASASVTLETPIVECTDHLKARTFELSEGGTMKGNVTHSGGSLSSNGVTVHSHVHGGVQGGSSNTGGRNDSPLYRHESGRHGPAYRYRSALEFSTRHTDHAAGKSGDATGLRQHDPRSAG